MVSDLPPRSLYFALARAVSLKNLEMRIVNRQRAVGVDLAIVAIGHPQHQHDADRDDAGDVDMASNHQNRRDRQAAAGFADTLR